MVRFLFRLGLLLGLFLILDQILLRTPFDIPVYREGRAFYLDFRQRLFGAEPAEPDSVASAIARDRKAPPPQEPVSHSEQAQRYLYADDNGELHFVESLDRVPARYRQEAQPLDE